MASDEAPLAGKTVVVTRPRSQAGEFSAVLESLGASVVEFPTIQIESSPDPLALRTAAERLAEYDWVVFTSVNGVERFWEALGEFGTDVRSFAGVRVCAIGPATGAALAGRGVRPDVIPDEYVAEAVVDALSVADDLRDKRVLLPRAEVARPVLPDGLRARGARVTEVAAYRTGRADPNTDALRPRLQSGEIDLITFTASSTVHNFVALVGSDLGLAEVASIGPITSATARELGLPVHIEATEYTIVGLTEAIRWHYAP